jgi:hypothetical protein
MKLAAMTFRSRPASDSLAYLAIGETRELAAGAASHASDEVS